MNSECWVSVLLVSHGMPRRMILAMDVGVHHVCAKCPNAALQQRCSSSSGGGRRRTAGPYMGTALRERSARGGWNL
ncbi:unnamed protein product [Merluccius merluccius]